MDRPSWPVQPTTRKSPGTEMDVVGGRFADQHKPSLACGNYPRQKLGQHMLDSRRFDLLVPLVRVVLPGAG